MGVVAPNAADDAAGKASAGPGRPYRQNVAELVQAASAGDKQAWEQLVDTFGATVWAVARRHRLNTADSADVSQTTWLRLLENIDRVQQPERIGAWLVTTARRESLRILRLTGYRCTADGYDFERLPDSAAAIDIEGALIAEQRNEILARLVNQLPNRSQTLLRLLSGDSPPSYKDISGALDMPVGSIGPTRGRALEQIRRLAARSGIELGDLLTR